MNPEEKRNILQQYLDGRETPEGKAYFDEWFFSQPTDGMDALSEQEQADLKTKLLQEVKKTIQLKEEESNQSVRLIPVYIKQPFRIAASIGLLLLSSVVLWQITSKWLSSPKPLTYQQHITRPGQQSKIRLSDGTMIYLNAASKLNYPQAFTGKERIVYLEGEAYFEVTRNEQKPFVIRTGSVTTTVLGTAFNVNAYPEDSLMQITVTSGKVKVALLENTPTASEMQTVTLVPNEQATYFTARNYLGKSRAEGKRVASWRLGNLIFEATPLSQVAKQLSRYYGVKILFANREVGNCLLTAEIKDATLEEALELVSVGAYLRYRIEGKTVTLLGTGCHPK